MTRLLLLKFRLTPLVAMALLAGCATPPAAIDSLGISFVRVPMGEFSMGSDEPVEALAAAYPGLERSRFEGLSDEAPVHRVRITKPFEMSRHEITAGQFRAFLKRSGHVPESIADSTGGYAARVARIATNMAMTPQDCSGGEHI